MTKEFMYNFKESKLGHDFAKEKLTEFKKLIDSSQSFTVVSMPGVGVSYFLKYLSCQDFAYFVHVDLYNLPSLSQHEFYRMFLRDVGGNPSGKSDEQVFIDTKEILKKIASKYKKIVIIFSRFDQLKKDLDENFLSNLQSLTTIALGKIVLKTNVSLIFTAIKPLDEIAPEAITGGNLPFYSKILYFKPYSGSDLKKLFTLEHTLKAHPELLEMIKLSGGHNQLLHIFINSHKKQNLLLDKFVKLQLKELVDYLDYSQKKQVQKMAKGHPALDAGSIDEYLLGVGYVTRRVILSERSESKDLSSYRLFSPVLAEYIKTNLPHKLPVKEKALFNLLRKNMGKVVSKDEIFKEVWGESEDVTDWALDALVYRLRNHPFTTAHGYIIESHKKVGYTLIQT